MREGKSVLTCENNKPGSGKRIEHGRWLRLRLHIRQWLAVQGNQLRIHSSVFLILFFLQFVRARVCVRVFVLMVVWLGCCQFFLYFLMRQVESERERERREKCSSENGKMPFECDVLALMRERERREEMTDSCEPFL